MPNHVTNILRVKGDAEEVERFRKTVCGDNPVLVEHLKKSMEVKIQKLEEQVAKGNKPFAKTELKRAKNNYKKDITVSHLHFEGTIPMPSELLATQAPCPEEDREYQQELQKKYGAGNWYNWERQNYGCKWGAYEVQGPEEIEDGLRYRFLTAWSAPDGWLQTTSKLFPSLEFTDSFLSEGGGAGVIRHWVDEDIQEYEELEEHEWLLENDPAFAEEYHWVTEGDYEELKNFILNEKDCFSWASNEKIFIERIPKEQLPLFIGCWEFFDDLFQERMQSI